MHPDFTVPMPNLPGKIGRFKKGNTTYIRYVVERQCHVDRKYSIPNHKIIRKAISDDPARMIPNENFLKYFGDTELPELKRDASRSSSIRKYKTYGTTGSPQLYTADEEERYFHLYCSDQKASAQWRTGRSKD